MNDLEQWVRRGRWGRLSPLSLLLLLLPLVFGSCGDSTAPLPANTVQVEDNAFSPASLTVTPGTTVTWNWTGTVAHNVTSDDGAFSPSDSKSSGSHLVTFNTAGTFHYHCTIHGTTTSGMRGTILVQGDSLASGVMRVAGQ